jgi:hypothetical protein
VTADISRSSLRPAQGFTGVVRQQGRLPLDADENEAADLAALALRRTVTDTICAAGTPDDGFRVVDPVVSGGALGFGLAAGNFYLQGVRVETEDVDYDAQPAWLTFAPDAAGPTIPDSGSRRDLVWLEAQEHVVTATEDTELYERALGGADTTARQRVTARVRVQADVPDDCAEALDQAVAEHYPGAVLDDDRVEVRSSGRLTLGFTELEPLEDLCRPQAQAGFLGARNETFRVQISRPGHFVWGRDNAAPVYRVQVADHPTDATRRRIVFLTQPRDGFGWPLAGMTVELLRWGALLANGEKAAEPTGIFLRVEAGYDPTTGSILVTTPVPADWDTWFSTPVGLAAQSERDDDDVRRYFFLRVWTGGAAEAAADVPFVAGTPVDLGQTGLTATFTGTALPGDHWIVSARPNTPTLVTPWALLDEAPPAGPPRLISPLALLPWSGDTPGTPIDCRHRFRRLCSVGGCCTIIVGDGRHSFGDVNSIQEAIDRLPPEGGEICLQAGTHRGNVRLTDAQDVTITGCGRSARWEGDPESVAPLLTLSGVQRIVVRRLTMVAGASDGIVVDDPDGAPGTSADVIVEDVRFVVRDRAAVAAHDVAGMIVRRCAVRLEPLLVTLGDDPEIGRRAAVFLSGSDLVVEDASIVGPPSIARHRLPVGGLHIGGPSERVVLRDNVIHGGNGPGITLGSVRLVPLEDDGDDGPLIIGVAIYVDERGCILISGTPPQQEEDEERWLAGSAGLLQDVRILRNDIEGAGGSGISSYVFSGLGADELGDAIAVEQLEVAGNRIIGCMRNELGTVAPLVRQVEGWGGIALAVCADAVIQDNLVAGNGEFSTDPISGIFIAVAEDVRIERNRIERNGGRATDETGPLGPGRRDGISIGVALGGVSTHGAASDPDRPSDRPALLIAGNTVDAPAGRALRAIALGPVMVQGNRLTGAGRSALFANLFRSLAVAGVRAPIASAEVLRPRTEIDLEQYAKLELLADLLGGDAVSLANLGLIEEFADLVSLTAARGPGDPRSWRGGETLVSDNQISLRRHSPEFGVTVSSVMLLGGDDVGFVDNQAEIESDVTFALTNVLAGAATLRVTGNRLQKRLIGGILSAVTLALMNQTALNQTTHCVFAVGLPNGRTVVENRSVFGLAYPSVCSTIEEWATSMSNRQASVLGLTGTPSGVFS